MMVQPSLHPAAPIYWEKFAIDPQAKPEPNFRPVALVVDIALVINFVLAAFLALKNTSQKVQREPRYRSER